MAIKLATAKRKDGTELHFRTSMGAVAGLNAALAEKQANLTQAQLDAANSGATAALIGKISTNESGISAINELIPGQATGTNQLADKDFVNSTVQTMSAAPISYDAAGNPFPTKADLDNATVFYNGGQEKSPDEHDYATVLADEEHGGAQTRYVISGGAWAFQFLVNDQPFTSAQNNAINSGITAGKVAEYDGIVAEMGDYGGGSETVTDDFFLATETEVGLGNENGIVEGTPFAYFTDNNSRIAKPTAQCVANTSYTNSSFNVDSGWYYWLATPYASNSRSVRFVSNAGTLNNDNAYNGYRGFRPLCNLKSEILVSDTPDTDGAYTILWNQPPTAPVITGLSAGQRLGASGNVAFTPSTDAEGDTLVYTLQFASNTDFTANVQEFTGNGSPIEYSGVEVNTTRYVRVVAGNGKAVTPSTAVQVKTGDVLEFISNPINRATKPVACRIIMDWTISPGAEYSLYVCNNANDASPTWENCSSEFDTNTAHYFTNNTKTDSSWAVGLKVVINAGTAIGPIEVRAFGFDITVS